MAYKQTGGATYTLASSIGSTDTTILLTSFEEPVSETPYTMSIMNTDICYATIAPKTSSTEFISFTGITQNVGGTATLTGVTRGLSRSYPYTTSATYKQAHSAQTQLILSNSPQFYEEFVNVRNAQTVSGVKTFSAFPLTASTAPSSNYEVANKKYVDDTAAAGVADATTTTAGKVLRATQAEADAKTALGTDGSLTSRTLFVNPSVLRNTKYNDYVVDTGIADAYVITPSPAITAYEVGQVFVFKAVHANTGASTLAVNGLATYDIKKNHDKDLVANDIEAGQMVVVVCSDGTVMQMVSQKGVDDTTLYQLLSDLDTTTTLGTSNTKYPSQLAVKTYVDTQVPLVNWKVGTTTYDTATDSGTQTIAHGLGRTPRIVFLNGMQGADSPNTTMRMSIGAYNGATQSCVWFDGNTATVRDGQSTAYSISFSADDSNMARGVVTVDATNITITWTKTGSPSGTASIQWSVQ